MQYPTCVICGNETSSSRAKKVCSQACRLVHESSLKKARHDRLKSDPAYLAERRASSRATYKKHAERTRTQRLAATDSWRLRNAEATTAYNLAYRRANPDQVRQKNQRRRARMMGAFVEDVDMARLWERDGGICGICLEPIDATIPWPHKLSKTLDHKIPLARGGEHSYANAQLAHAVCNSRKNDSLPPSH